MKEKVPSDFCEMRQTWRFAVSWVLRTSGGSVFIFSDRFMACKQLKMANVGVQVVNNPG